MYMLALLTAVILAVSSVGIGVSVINSAPSPQDEHTEPIRVFKYYDKRQSMSGQYQEGVDEPVEGWEFELWREDVQNNTWEKLDTDTTGSDGYLYFGDYPVDEHYKVREYLPDNWYNTGKAQYEGTEVKNTSGMNSIGLTEYDQDTEEYVEVTFEHFEPSMVEFGNAEYGDITAYKYNELEEPIEGWEMTLMDDDMNVLHTAETNETGEVTFEELRSGTYYVEEETREGWYSGDEDAMKEVVVDGGEHEEVWFTNTEYANITVCKMNQYEEPLEDWTFNLWEAEEGEPIGEPIKDVTTGENGCATFENVTYGDYIVQEELKPGWHNMTELLKPVSVEPGEHEEVMFMNTEYANITVYKYDESGDPLEDWTFNLWEAEDGEPIGEPIDTVETDENGMATFEEVIYGDYIVQEELEDGWHNNTDLLQPVSVEPGEHGEVWFENTELGDIHITKYLDDVPYEGMEFYLYEGDEIEDGEEPIMNGTTGEDGTLMFEDLVSGNYTIEEMIPDEGDEEYPWLPITDPVQTVTVKPGEVTDIEFYNEKAGIIEGMKFLDKYQTGEFDVGVDKPLKDWTIYLYEEDHDDTSLNAGHYYMKTETDEHGEYEFIVPAGDYVVEEEMPEGWWNVTDMSVPVTVGAEETVEVNFGNCEYKDVYGIKYYDYDMNGEFNEETDWVLEGWNITLYNDQGEMVEKTQTDHNGYYFFDGLEPGTYHVQEEVPFGWGNSTPSEVEIEFEHCCSPKQMVNFGNYEFAEVEINKYLDYNWDGEYNTSDGDYLLQGETVGFDVLGVRDGVTVFDQTLGVEGTHSFLVEPGEFNITEQLPAGSTNTTPLTQINTLQPGDSWEAWFGNIKYGNIHVCKYYDEDMNGMYDEGEDMLANWTFNLWTQNETGAPDDKIDTVTTNDSGCATFEEVLKGDYIVQEVLKDKWYNTTSILQPVTVEPGEEYERWFGNVPCGTIDGYKYCDYKMMGEWYEGIEPIEGWEIYLYKEEDYGETSIQAGHHYMETTTNETGYYSFDCLDPQHDYVVEEETPEDWYIVGDSTYHVDLMPGAEEERNFFNYQHHDITGIKFYDFNMNGTFEPMEGDIPLRDRTVELYMGEDMSGDADYTTTTDEYGYYSFVDLEPGTYTVYQPKACCEWEHTTPREVTVEIKCDDVEVNFGEYKMSTIDVYVEDETSGVGIEIYEYDPDSGSTGAQVDSGETGPDGWYISIELEPGYYMVELEDEQSEMVQLRMGEQVEFNEPTTDFDSMEIMATKARYAQIK